MERAKYGTPFQPHDIPALLEAARFAVLRKARQSELQDLVVALELACDMARINAIHALPKPGQIVDQAELAPRNFGFAKLFAALRCARLELKRRHVSSGRLTASGQQKPVHDRAQTNVIAPTAKT